MIYKDAIQHRGYNNDSGLIYRKCGSHQYSKSPIFPQLGLNPIKYSNKKNVNDVLIQANSKKGQKPDFYRGSDKDIKQQANQIYYDVPKVEIGGKKQTTYDGPD